MTEPIYADGLTTLHFGDCLDVIERLPDASVDAVVTDPPYGLEFMGREWDRFGRETGNHAHREKPRFTSDHMDKGFDKIPNTYEAGLPYQKWCSLWAAECLRVLKPGGHLLAFGGTRTYHRLACAVEDAGFEIRDSISWLYGSGFPKSLDVSKAIDKTRDDGAAIRWSGWGTALKPAHEPIVVGRKPLTGTVARNVLEHGTGALNIDACRVNAIGRPLIASRSDDSTGIYGNGLNGSRAVGTTDAGRWPANVVLDEYAAAELDRQGDDASRFFSVFRYQAKAPTRERPKVNGEAHPTVKPLELMRWLVRLVAPPGGVVLDPFGGSGTTGEACIREGFQSILIEKHWPYIPLIFTRILSCREGS